MISLILATFAVHENSSITAFKIALKHFCFFPPSLKRSVRASLVLQNVKAQIFAFLERTCVMVIMTVEI